MVAVLAFAWSVPGANAQEPRPMRGVALVIGNGAYDVLPPLANPVADARAMEALFASLGFSTELSSDRNGRRLRRDLEDFTEDAEGADVAVIYYAGHGIEAGGENYLVATDADPAHPAEALVALTDVVERLRETVAVVIVLLDACRDNPFPPGTTLRATPDGPAVEVSAAGLGATRGAAPLASEAAVESLGALLGFAAEPGRAALDGEPGGNSPYAAAMLRHLETMAGEEFGTVMRMVAEEVYLKTGGRQRPWTSESLRRLLHFGAPQPAPQGEESEILGERRQLLLTISVLPEYGRRQVEAVAASRRVPLDALYAMLDALGEEAPHDPDALERLLSAQAERLRGMLAERAVLASTDEEIVRLASLAAEALQEGAMRSAIRFHERAKRRIDEISGALDSAEAQLRQRRIEFADVYGRSAQAYALGFRHLDAAADWRRAHDQVARWDDRLALRYKLEEAGSLAEHGQLHGDASVLAAALAAGEDALRLAAVPGFEAERIAALDQQAAAWKVLGEVTGDLSAVERAVDLHREALAAINRAAEPEAWAALSHNLGNSLHVLGESAATGDLLEEALAAFGDASTVWSRETHPQDWALLMVNTGNTLWRLAERDGRPESLMRAANAHQAALEVWTRETNPLGWAMAANNLGNVLFSLVERNYDERSARYAIEAMEAALGEYTRERAPLRWAMVTGNLANAYRLVGYRNRDAGLLHRAIALFEAVLDEVSTDEGRQQWASVHNGLGNAWSGLYEVEGDGAAIDRAIAAFGAVLEVWTADTAPLDRALAMNNLGIAYQMKWIAGNDPAAYDGALASFEAALQGWSREAAPGQWANAQANIGTLYLHRGRSNADRLALDVAIGRFDAALEVWTRRDSPDGWARTMNNRGLAQFELARLIGDADLMLSAAGTFSRSLEVRTRETMPLEWGRAMDSIGLAFYEAASLSGEAAHAGEAARAWQAAREHFSALGETRYEQYFADRIALARTLAE